MGVGGGAHSQTCTHHLSLERGSSGEADFCQLLMPKLGKNDDQLRTNVFLCTTSVSGCCYGPQLLRCYTTWHLTPTMPAWAFDWWLIFCQIKSKFHYFFFMSVCWKVTFSHSLICSLSHSIIWLNLRFDCSAHRKCCSVLGTKANLRVSEYYEDKYYQFSVGPVSTDQRGTEGKDSALLFFSPRHNQAEHSES